MLNESVVNDLIKLINLGMITIAEIKDLDYKTEVENRLT